MADPQETLRSLRPTKEFFIGIDSDGCAFDTMEIKHKECFCPQTVRHWRLQSVSRYARETWEFVNLYGRSRGCNRFIALCRVLDLLRERREVRARGAAVPDLSELKKWTAEETKLGNPALAARVAETGSEELAAVLRWSEDINAMIAEWVFGVPPFPWVRESLDAAAGKADMLVVSQTPVEALRREWEEHGMDRYVREIAGQEFGKKSEHLALAAAGKYPADKILMIGDAYGDLKAARDNGVLFYPIVPGREEESWKRFHDEALGRFFDGTFAGAYEDALVRELEEALPERPPWDG